MAGQSDAQNGPDLARGVALGDIPPSGLLRGHVGEEPVLLARSGEEIFAIGAQCTHYGASLADGVLDGDTVRCPWHHACFSLRTGEAIRTPAFDPVGCWKVEQRDGKIFVAGRIEPEARTARRTGPAEPERIIIVGGGAAGFAAAEMLRREGYGGSVTMVSSDEAAPVDRPNLSKDYLAGNAPEEWVPLRPASWYDEHEIELRLATEVETIDVAQSEIRIAGGARLGYDRLLLATGAEPVRLDVPGVEQPHVHLLRSLADSRSIIAAAQNARRAVVIGASFIGLEVAASLRTRGLDVHVVGPEKAPLERVFGPALAAFVRRLHEEHGVVFHLENTVERIEPARARLKSGLELEADLIVVGIGVRPRISLAETAGLKCDRGVAVDAYLQTSAPGIFAAGDIARWPDPHSGERIRVEHWVVAERQGQAAARNMLSAGEPYAHVPFFWSQHYDVPINYVGHAERWDAIEVDGDIDGRDCVVRYRKDGKVLAVASIYRDVESLEAEIAMERDASADRTRD